MTYSLTVLYKSLRNKNNYFRVKSKLKQLFLYFLLFPIIISISDGQIPRPPKGGITNCDHAIFNYLPDDCSDQYIKNGCFECYYTLKSNDGYADRSYSQLEYAIGGIFISPVYVPTSYNKLSLCCGWYSPTYSTPNYFNYDNNGIDPGYEAFPYFGVGWNYFNTDHQNFGNHLGPPRYPLGWFLDVNYNIVEANNYGYVGFWVEPNTPNEHEMAKYEYIQQKLLKPLLPGHRYQLSYYASKNHSNIGGSQKLGVYFSPKSPFSLDEPSILWTDQPKDQYDAISDGILYQSPVISEGPDQYGLGGWQHVEEIIDVPMKCDFITIGFFKKGEDINDNDELRETAFYIDNIHITDIPEDCPCDYYPGCATHSSPSVEISVIPTDNCCYEFFFHNKIISNCILEKIECKVYLLGRPELLVSDSYYFSSSDPQNDFIFREICITDALLHQIDPNISNSNHPEAIFRFEYSFIGGSSCTIDQKIKLTCDAPCQCQYEPSIETVKLIKNPLKPCCYEIELKMNNDNEIEKYCKFDQAIIYEKVDGDWMKLFDDFPNSNNGIIETGGTYYYPGKTINISNDKWLCFDPTTMQLPPSKIIKVALRKMGTTNYCEFLDTIIFDCPIPCSQLASLSNSLIFELIPKYKGVEDENCCFIVMLRNYTGYNVKIPKVLLNFSSPGSNIFTGKNRISATDFALYSATSYPSTWYSGIDPSNQSIYFSDPNCILNNSISLQLGEICIPESDQAVNIEFNIKDAYSDNYCTIQEELISCPPNIGCQCDESSLLNFTLTAQEKSDSGEPCCYVVTLIPPNQYLNCAINEVEIFVKLPGATSYGSTPDLNLTLSNFNSPITLSAPLQQICITPVNGNSAFSVKVIYKNTTTNPQFICEREQTVSFDNCPCSCDEDGLNFQLINYPIGSCCFDVLLNSDCQREFSEILMQFPSSIASFMDESYFSSFLNNNNFTKLSNDTYVNRPSIPIRIQSDLGIYLGSFCLPPLPPEDRPVDITLTAKDINGGDCKVQPIGINCSCCDNATVIVNNSGGCCWSILANNTPGCYPPMSTHVSIYDITNGVPIDDVMGTGASILQLCLGRSQTKQLDISWSFEGNTLCKKIITLSCSESGSPNAKKVVSFENINNNIIENFEFAPNPANSEANIRFDLLQDVKTLSLSVYNIKGVMVATIPVSNFNKGQNYINLNTTGINSGSYYLVLNADNAKMCLPITILR